MYNPEIFFVTFIPETNSFLAHAHKILQNNLMYVAERLEIDSIILYPERNNVNIASEYKPYLEKAIEKAKANNIDLKIADKEIEKQKETGEFPQ